MNLDRNAEPQKLNDEFKDPAIRAEVAERRRLGELEKSRARQDEAPIVRELKAAGLRVESVWDLVNDRRSFPAAVPILLRWLPRATNPLVKESTIRALRDPAARGIVASALICEFHKTESDYLRWVIGNTLSVVADDNAFIDLVAIVHNRNLGKAREMVTVALGNMTSPRVVEILVEALKDPEIAGQAMMALAKVKHPRPHQVLKPFLTHRQAWVRRAAQRAMKRANTGRTSDQGT